MHYCSLGRCLSLAMALAAVFVFSGCAKNEKFELSDLGAPELKVSVNGRVAEISWTSIKDASHYDWSLCLDGKEQESGSTSDSDEVSLRFEELLPGDYLFEIKAISGDNKRFRDSGVASETFQIKDGVPDDTDAFELRIIEATTEGVEYEYIPKDKEMYYSDFWGEPSFFVEYSDQELIDEIVGNVNEALAEFYLEYLLDNSYIFQGDVRAKGHARELGFEWQVGVVGLEYDEAAGRFCPITNLYKTEPFEINVEPEPDPEAYPWADMRNPRYEMHNGLSKLIVEVVPNEYAAGYVYGKAYPENYLDTHSESEVINELLDISNMDETWIADWDMYLRAEAEPGEKLLFAVATMDQEGKKGNKLNWMILKVPDSIGGKVQIIDSATGEVTPPDEDLAFEVSVTEVEGTKVYFSVLPSDNDRYYHVGYATESDMETLGEDEVLASMLQSDINRLMLIYDYSFESLCDLGIIRKGPSGGEYDYLDEEFENGNYYLCVFGVEQSGDRVAATTPLTTVPFTITEGAVGPTVECTYTVTDGGAYGYSDSPMVIYDFKMSEECFSFKYADMFAPGTFASMSEDEILEYFENPENAYSEETQRGWTEYSQDKSEAVLYQSDAWGTSMEVIIVGYDLLGVAGEPVVVDVELSRI